MFLFLVFTIQQRGQYRLISPSQILNYKLWTLREFIEMHDTYLGQLPKESITMYSHPYQTPRVEGEKFDLLEKKGWYVMDVLGDGNCGYYALFLGLQNAGKNDFHINTSEETPRTAKSRWQNQVITLRQRLKAGSDNLLKNVFPTGSPNRSQEWCFHLPSVSVFFDDV